MNIQRRTIQLYADHCAEDPYFVRIVRVNDHTIELVVYASGREECRINGATIATDTVEMIRINAATSCAAEAFEQLSGFWPADWDRVYRRLYWHGWMDSTRTWWLTYTPAPAQLRALCRRHIRY